MRHPALAIFVLSLWLSACAAPTPSPLAPTITLAAPTYPASPTPYPNTPAPQSANTPAPFPTPTPFQHPMAIETLRMGRYPGSEIGIEKELSRGANYRRYYAFYFSEGLKIYALLTVPDGDAPEGGWPALVFNHGYIPPDEYRTTERYVDYVDRLARAGYIVFRIDYRGHDNSQGEATGAYGDPGYTVDVLNAVASLKQFPEANPGK
ncbi:MAG: CocE/NonD family hydrolase, partial [Chloroflexota bacterium]